MPRHGGRNGRQDSPKREPETKVRVWVHTGDCARIIGRQGRQMNEIQSRSRTHLDVQREEDSDRDSKERYIDIVGDRAGHKIALELLLELASFCREDEGTVLKDIRNPTAPAADAGEEGKTLPEPLILEVLPQDVGKVLGRKGETVKLIEKESGAKIELEKTTGKLEIHGRKEAQDKAVELILNEVTFAKKAGEGGEILKDAPRGRPADGEPEAPPLRLWVKDRDAGKVIGRGGETVREIMEKSHTDIKVQKGEEMRAGTTEREIKIFGSKEQQEEALKLVLAEVSWANGVDGILKAPPEADKALAIKDKDEKDPPKEAKERPRTPPARTPPRRSPPRRSSRSAAGRQSQADKERELEAARARDRREGKDRGDRAKSAVWVCATCGGDHRTRECPHSTGLLGMGMQLGMQMGLQAMGLPMGMGMPPMMGPFGPMMPGMGLPGLPGLPGMPPFGVPPGAASSGSSSSSSGSGSRSPSVDGGAGTEVGQPAEGRHGKRRRRRRRGEVEAAQARQRRDGERGGAGAGRRKRRRRGASAEGLAALEDAAPPIEVGGEGPGAYVNSAVGGQVPGQKRRRRRRRDASGSPGDEEDADRARAAAAAAALAEAPPPSPARKRKKKIHMTDL